jgi:3-phenylpropionate/trans-cinnamate dioxygenase ferredoxin reductase subunit
LILLAQAHLSLGTRLAAGSVGFSSMPESATVLPSSWLAFATTIHAAMLVLRLHRGHGPRALLLAIPSLALGATPWLLPSTLGLAAGLGTHLAWFVACERLAPPPARATASRPPAAARPVALPARPREQSAPAPKGGFVPVPVLGVYEETPVIRTFRMARPEGFSFKAGQFLTIRVQAEGRPLTRCYSISSSPETPGYLEISVKRQGPVSNLLHATLRPGVMLAIGPPAGPFVYPAADDRPLVLVAGGIGITPLLSMLRHAVAAEPSRRVTLIYSARSLDDLAFSDELSLVARHHPQVRVVITLTGQRHEGYRHGRVDAATLSQLVPEPAGCLFMLCGPLPMIDSMRDLLIGLGVPASQVRSEAFEAAVAVATATTTAGEAGGKPAQVTFSVARKVVEAGDDESLLDVAERGGVNIPSLCRAGVCGTCRTRLTAGDADCSSDALDDDDRGEGWVLPCVTRARGDCVLEA